MNAPLRSLWTREQFFTWASSQGGRYEFDGFQPVAMTGGTANHSIIIQNVIVALRERLRGSGCRPLGPDARLLTAGGAVRYPDALVTCSKFAGSALTIPDVVVVFEVVGPSSGRIDRIVKVGEYAAVETIRRYVILESTSVGLTVFERFSVHEPWRAVTLTSADEILPLPELGVDIPVGAFYADVVFAGGDIEAGEASAG